MQKNNSGRPPKKPEDKINTPVRALVTKQVATILAKISEKYGIKKPTNGSVSSDIVRLYVLKGMLADGVLPEEILQDPTWESLKSKGLI